MFHRGLSHVLCLILALAFYLSIRVAAQVASPSFVTGSAEDQAAIRDVIALEGRPSKEHKAVDLDWENAFGGRFNSLDRLDAFLSKRLGPTLATATDTTLEIKIRFIDASIAVADEYWRLVGQVEPATGNTLPERWGRTTYILKKSNGSWTLILERVADLRAPWYQHLTSLPSPVSVPASTLALYPGTYQATPGWTYEISREGDRLAVKSPEGVGVAIPRSDTEFFYFRDPSVPGNHAFIRFSKLPDGTMTFTESGPGNDRPILLKKIR